MKTDLYKADKPFSGTLRNLFFLLFRCIHGSLARQSYWVITEVSDRFAHSDTDKKNIKQVQEHKVLKLKSMSKVVALIARIVVFSLIFNESSFSLLISILSTEHYNLCRKKLEKEDFFGSKMKMKNFELIEKCSKTRRIWYHKNPLSFAISNI